MSVVNNSRRFENIQKQINKHESIEEYIKTLSSTTVKNYKRLLYNYIEENFKCQKEISKLKKLVMDLSRNEDENEAKYLKILDSILKDLNKELTENEFISKNSYDIFSIFLFSVLSGKELSTFNPNDLEIIERERNALVSLNINGKNKMYLFSKQKKLFKYVVSKIKENNDLFVQENIHNHYHRVQKEYEMRSGKTLYKGGILKLRDTFSKNYLIEII